MSKPRKPLDPASSSLAAFAYDLRAQQESAGLSHRALAAAMHYSHVAFVKATGGDLMPSWAVTEAFLIGCGVADEELASWETRWQQVQAELRQRRQKIRAAERAARRERAPQSPRDANQADVDAPAPETRAQGPNHAWVPATWPKLYQPRPEEITDFTDLAGALLKLKTSAGLTFREMSLRTSRSYSRDVRALATSTMHDLCRPGRKRMDWHNVHSFLQACGVQAPEALMVWKLAHEAAAQGTAGSPNACTPDGAASAGGLGARTGWWTWRSSLAALVTLLVLAVVTYLWLR